VTAVATPAHRARTERWWRWALLIPAVVLAHAVLMSWLSQHLPTLNSAVPRIERFELAFVQDLKPAEPERGVAPQPALSRSPVSRVVVPVAAAASAPLAQPVDPPAPASSQPALSARQDSSPVAQSDGLNPVSLASAQAHDQVSVAQAPESADSPQAVEVSGAEVQGERASVNTPSSMVADPGASPFDWPPSTRLSYHLVGDYRGPVEGHARVEWLRQDSRYQVHLDVNIASVVNRRLSSEGSLNDQGLRPQRYEELTRVIFSAPRQRTVRFENDRVILANGRSELALPQVQDTASQFVQLAWLFATQRAPLTAGGLVEIPLALPGRMDRWTYRVQAEEELELPVGSVKAIPLRPERLQAPAGEMSIQTWFAPSLQYLPVRILIRQDAQTFVDLRLSRLLQQVSTSESVQR
jgi:Protein of unknown function (DUF3108)